MTYLNELFDRLSSTSEEYDKLYESDNLYIAWAKKRDDEKLDGFVNDIDSAYYNWSVKLIGEAKSKAKIKNGLTDNYLQGHIFSVNKNQVDMFEKVALMPSMKHSYRFEKYDVNALKEKEKEEILKTLNQDNE
jgi:hypothetical protein